MFVYKKNVIKMNKADTLGLSHMNNVLTLLIKVHEKSGYKIYELEARYFLNFPDVRSFDEYRMIHLMISL